MKSAPRNVAPSKVRTTGKSLLNAALCRYGHPAVHGEFGAINDCLVQARPCTVLGAVRRVMHDWDFAGFLAVRFASMLKDATGSWSYVFMVVAVLNGTAALLALLLMAARKRLMAREP